LRGGKTREPCGEEDMKFSAILCASVLGLVGLALTVDSAVAATNLNSSKSNTAVIDSSDAAAKACTDKGGVVTTAVGGQKSCTLPASPCLKIINGTSSSIDIDDPVAIRACFDACGAISTDQSGQKVCTKPGPMPAPTPTREPHN
jgi:hypothetical protein